MKEKDLLITTQSAFNIISNIKREIKKEDYLKHKKILIEVENFIEKKEKEHRKNIRNNSYLYHNISLQELILLLKDVFSSCRFKAGIGHTQIQTSDVLKKDISKNDRKIIQYLLFDIVGSHHWSVAKIITLQIYPHHVTSETIDKSYYNRSDRPNGLGNCLPLLKQMGRGFFSLNENVNSIDLLGQDNYLVSEEFQKLYFIQDQKTKCVKIGYSINPELRLREIRACNSNNLELVAIYSKNGRKLESEFHTIFNSFRKHGEWFRDNIALNYLINKINNLKENKDLEKCIQDTKSIIDIVEGEKN